MYFKFTLMISLILNLWFLISIYGSSTGKQGDWLIVNPKEKSCINDWHEQEIIDEHSVYGPDNLKGYTSILVKSSFDVDTFEFKYSSCFYSAVTTIFSEKEVSAVVNRFKEQGYQFVGVYKNPYNSEIVITASRE